MKTKSAESMIALTHWKTNSRELKTSTKLTFRISILARRNHSRQRIAITISRENSIIRRTVAITTISWIKTIDLTQATPRVSIVTAKTLIPTSSSNRRIQDRIRKETTLLAPSIEVVSAHLTITSNSKLMNHPPFLVAPSPGSNNSSMNQWRLKNNNSSNTVTWATPKLNHTIVNPSEKASRDLTTIPWNSSNSSSNNKSSMRRCQHSRTCDNLLLKILLRLTRFWIVLIRPSRNWSNHRRHKMMLNNQVSWSIRCFSSNNSNRFSNSSRKSDNSIPKVQPKTRRKNSEDVRNDQLRLDWICLSMRALCQKKKIHKNLSRDSRSSSSNSHSSSRSRLRTRSSRISNSNSNSKIELTITIITTKTTTTITIIIPTIIVAIIIFRFKIAFSTRTQSLRTRISNSSNLSSNSLAHRRILLIWMH